MNIAELSDKCAALRNTIDLQMEVLGYDIEQVADLLEQLNRYLCKNTPPQNDIESFALFLQQNLDWLQATMAKLSADKDAVAGNMLEIKKGHRARHSYGQNN